MEGREILGVLGTDLIIITLKIFSFTFVYLCALCAHTCMCVHTFMYVHICMCVGVYLHMCWESILCSHHVSPGNEIQLISCGSKLSHLVSSRIIFSLSLAS